MKIVAERKDLAKAVALAQLASGRASKDVALANVLIRLGQGATQASIESYDTHVYSRASFLAQGDPGEFALEGARLDHLVATADDGLITLETDANGVTASYGRASIKLRTFPLDKYVRFTVTGEQQSAQGIRAGLFLHALEFVKPFVGKDTQKPNQMLAELRNQRFLAGDGVRIGAVSIPSLNFRLKVPQAVINNVVRWLKEGTSFLNAENELTEGMIDVSETPDFYIFRTTTGLSHFAWRKPEHDFLAVEKHLVELERDDAPEAILFKVDQKSLQRAVDSLSVVLEAGAEKINFNMTLNGQPMLIGTAQDSRGVPSNNEVQIVFPEGKTPPEVSGFNIRYSHLLDTLGLMMNPVISCNVRKDKSILRIAESHPEMSKMALLTLMQEG